MAFSEIELKRIDNAVGKLCQKRSPAHLRDKFSLEFSIKGHDVLIYERRPQWNKPSDYTESAIAKLKYFRTANEWRLFWRRASLKWESYKPFPTSKVLNDLVVEVDNDPFGTFFG